MSEMVENPEIYFSKHIPARDSLLIKLEEEARNENIPIVGPVVGELLFLLARITQAKRILELGTATGYSAIFLARACKTFDGKVVTLENNSEMVARAQPAPFGPMRPTISFSWISKKKIISVRCPIVKTC